MKLGLFTTHPIQYQVPWFRALHKASTLDLTVYYDHIPNPEQQGKGFGKAFSWDLPLLDGYDWKVRSRNDVAQERHFRLWQAVASSDVALITGWQALYLIKATLLASISRTPLLVRGESNALKLRPPHVKLLHRLYLSAFDVFLTIGEANAEFYRQYGIDNRRLYACPYFVDNERFENGYQQLLPQREQFRSEFGVPSNATCFLFAGKFIDKKRPLDLLHALHRLSDMHSELHLLMVGDGVLMPEARALAHQHELPVTFTGFLNQSEIGKAYTAADVLILPSDYGETWGLVVNEAMIFENPAIVSDRVGCGPDLIDDGKTGFTFPFGDIEQLANAMQEIVDHPSYRKEMGQHARHRVLKGYSVEKAVNGTLQAAYAAYEKK